MAFTFLIFLLLSASFIVLAQFPPIPTDLTVVESQVDPRVTISFKETEICERTPGVRTYSGFVHLPASILADIGGYDINTYFICFEARNDATTAPLAIYLAGGPGESSIYAALASESGPCYVNIDGTDTIINTWSFNNHVNMLYIDQPVQTGYSYDKLVNATFDLLGGIAPFDFDPANPPPVNATVGYGTYPSQDFKQTASTTVQAAKALWHFAEHWLSSFPGYTTDSKKIGIWGNSYGGYWVPETAAQISKNLKALDDGHALKSRDSYIDAIGITNGCVDAETSLAGWPEYAYNNTYGIRFGSEALYEEVMYNLTKTGGCQDLVQQCRAVGEIGDPEYNGSNATVNEICTAAFGYCELYVIGAFPKLNERNPFDIAESSPPTCPYYLPVGQYLNTGAVQEALGAPLNFTYDSAVVTANFGLAIGTGLTLPASKTTGDLIRQNGQPNIEYLLAEGVKVAFVFGDRDYRCPWTGGEMTALAAKWEHQSNFVKAGYEEMQGITTSASDGGYVALVKQHSRFSFSRVLDSGHSVSAYAPETVYRIFQRTMDGLDVSTGTESVDDGYHTEGPTTSWQWTNTLPKNTPETCMVEGRFQDTNPWAVILG